MPKVKGPPRSASRAAVSFEARLLATLDIKEPINRFVVMFVHLCDNGTDTFIPSDPVVHPVAIDVVESTESHSVFP
jgi:hypothetical protein